MSSHPVRIAKIEALALSASFDELYDSPDDVPDWLRYPASSHLVLPRRGQYATLVKVHAEDGTVGIGECYGLPSPQVTATVVTTVLAPLLIGQDALATTAVWERLYQGQAAGGHNRGFYLEALAGIDLALWDLRGKLAGVPVHRLLGGPVRERIDCYASPVALHADPADSARQALGFVEEGFKALKVKIGRGERTDRAHLTAVREAVGEDIDILTDVNCAYDLDQATRVGGVLRDLGISWYEEPLQVDDLANLGELRRRTGLTIVNGETHFTRFDLRDSLLNRAIDVFMPNVARCGGFTEATRLAALASAFHVDIAPHGVGSGVSLCAALQLCAATPNLRTYEYNRLPNPIRERILTDPPEFRDGALTVPQAPGLGAEIDDDVVDRYTIARF
ncbi:MULTISPECIES: mandelate racemase/muconate lactonizing enzyme family protein [Streptomyces]|uniref:Mandelate racemase/muconate lactonizing enzyme family protein n=1 Tax=Streptomyces koelreuteriae TaxID=2838015 RepID=A0ABX8G0Y8_9ACTN|nr:MULTISPECIES: mandelate racemase/muconate lactonizing enzyme family protein [Streptomyces]QWB27188.1 mandelate racemase/muconate lactonizing enzyme family protein [Streptomyces koelreuteriae]UUA10271.1 mandelate racemase/muconate lactonizing enzyme family protein [Streptomyces koelreuteriae]UUA17878.1 mandelate racemase/muconate lactonizing enzyme family protein [Streptomyces sp. CRCS-T-1]